MNEVLLDPFRHNAWATKEVITACRPLSDEQLGSAAVGSFGSIIATLNHLVSADAGYLRALTGHSVAWLRDDAPADLDELDRRVDETSILWGELLAQPLDPERVIILDRGTYEAHAGILVGQALHHGNSHREQVAATLTMLGLEPPDLQVWAYADATGRGRPRSAPSL